MRLNLNDIIKVKLTDHGKDIYYHQYDMLNASAGRELCKPSYPKVDKDGYTTFQLWCFMELYGVHMGMALPNVIKPLDIVFDAPTIEPERKTGKWIHGRELSREMIGDVVTAIFYEGWECSECHCLVSEEHEPLWKFCPNCGAKMEGVKDDVSL